MVLNVYLTQGLEGGDQHVDILSHLFEESQVVTIETADPALDLISFVQDCRSFWVINAVNGPAPVEPLTDNAEEDYGNSLGLYPPVATSSTGYSVQNPFPDFTEQPSQAKNIAGFVYLVPSAAYPDPLHFQEYNIGIVLRPQWRGQGVGIKALHSALNLAFSRSGVHRAQAQLLDCYKNDRALRLFTRMGFSHEGMKRQCFLCPLTQEWKDVTTLGMVVTDWVVRVHDDRSESKSLWDALFARHQKEREELLRWEDRRPRRSSSLETIRERSTTPVQEFSEVETDSETGSVVSEREGIGKRKLFEIGDETDSKAGDAYDASGSEYESEYESCVGGSSPKRVRSEAGPGLDGERRFGTDWYTWRPNHPAITGQPENLITGLGLQISPARNSVISGPTLSTIPLPELLVDAQDEAHDHEKENWENQSPSPSPEPRAGSLASVPPSSESEPDDGYTSSSTASSWSVI